MSANCGRCKESEAVFECADCVGSKRRGELVPLCNGCNELIHVGFLGEHQVVSVTIKQQKKTFEEQLDKLKSQGKHLQLKLQELGYARQDIEQRSQYNQQAVSQAFQALWQALKQKEHELANPLKDSSKKKATQLADCEKTITRAISDFKSLCSDAQKVLQGNSVEFALNYEQMNKKLEEFEIVSISDPFPSLGCPARVDVTGLLQSIRDLGLHAVDDAEGPAADASADPKKEGDDEIGKEQSSGPQETATPELQSPKEGDTLQVYVESRMDTRGHFWVTRNLSEDVASLYEDLSFKLRQDFVQGPSSHAEIVEGMLCCGQYQEDHRWYRGKVEQVKRDKGLARIRWLDYAHDNEVPLSAVQPLKEEFQTVPFQALECCLFDDLEDDLPHQARWEFSDHTANTMLDCTVLKQIPSSTENGSPVYLVDLKNATKEVDIKAKVLERAEEASSNKDTIMCRDIRYMKDYVPPVTKATKKDASVEKPKVEKNTKEVKGGTSDEVENVNKESQSEGTKGEATKAAETSGGEEGDIRGGDGQDEGRVKVDAGGDDGGGRGDGVTDQRRSSGRQDGEQTSGVVSEKSQEESPGRNGGTADGESSAVGNGVSAVDSIPDSTTSSKPKEAVQNQKPQEGVNGHIEDIPQRLPGMKPSGARDTPSSQEQSSSSQNGQPESQKAPDTKRLTAAEAGDYSVEPNEEEGADPQLIESMVSQSDQVMAHNPDDGFRERSANSERMAYYDGGAYHPYSSSSGYRSGSGMFGGEHHQPPVALGLSPMVPSTDASGSSSVPGTKSEHGDGSKIVVDSSINICTATPLSDKGRFWATRMRGPAQESQLRRLMHDISMPSDPLTLDKLKEVKLVCAQSPSGQWCRARVEGFMDDKVQVRYIDFGQADVVEEHRIKTLPVTCQLFPFQALELSIATPQHSRFSEKAREAFMRYTQNRALMAKVIADDADCVFVALYCMDENRVMYDISSAVLNTGTDDKPKERQRTVAQDTHRGSREEQNDDVRYCDTQDVRYDYQSEGRSHDRGPGGDRCFVCNNFGHLSYDCPNKGRDRNDRNDRNYRNKGGSKKQQGWSRRNRKY